MATPGQIESSEIRMKRLHGDVIAYVHWSTEPQYETGKSYFSTESFDSWDAARARFLELERYWDRRKLTLLSLEILPFHQIQYELGREYPATSYTGGLALCVGEHKKVVYSHNQTVAAVSSQK